MDLLKKRSEVAMTTQQKSDRKFSQFSVCGCKLVVPIPEVHVINPREVRE